MRESDITHAMRMRQSSRTDRMLHFSGRLILNIAIPLILLAILMMVATMATLGPQGIYRPLQVSITALVLMSALAYGLEMQFRSRTTRRILLDCQKTEIMSK